MATYTERVLRYRIMCHEDLPEAHKAAYREAGIDPNDLWTLIWSFAELDSAERRLARCREKAASWETYRLVDAGGETLREREIW